MLYKNVRFPSQMSLRLCTHMLNRNNYIYFVNGNKNTCIHVCYSGLAHNLDYIIRRVWLFIQYNYYVNSYVAYLFTLLPLAQRGGREAATHLV